MYSGESALLEGCVPFEQAEVDCGVNRTMVGQTNFDQTKLGERLDVLPGRILRLRRGSLRRAETCATAGFPCCCPPNGAPPKMKTRSSWPSQKTDVR